MRWLNYHHLLYFYVAAREGGIVPASKVLQLSHPTISSQIRKLELAMGETLFDRQGRRLVLTDVGRLVYRYAEEIFGLGQELLDAVAGRPTSRGIELRVGITEVVPKLVIRALLEPAYELPEPVKIICHEASHAQLLARLATHELDLILADVPVPPGSRIKAFNHRLGRCGVVFLGRGRLARRYRKGFPASLDGAPMLLPTRGTSLRRELDHWFDRNDLRPDVIGEFEDSALLKVFGQHGHGLFPTPAVIEEEVIKQYGVSLIGRADDVLERFFAISVERRLQNPAAVAICEAARHELFSEL